MVTMKKSAQHSRYQADLNSNQMEAFAALTQLRIARRYGFFVKMNPFPTSWGSGSILKLILQLIQAKSQTIRTIPHSHVLANVFHVSLDPTTRAHLIDWVDASRKEA